MYPSACSCLRHLPDISLSSLELLGPLFSSAAGKCLPDLAVDMEGTDRETPERRHDKRVPFLLPCTMTLSTGRAGGIVLDLSINGCRLRTRQVLIPGKLVLLHMETDKPVLDLRIDGAIIRWARNTDYGVEFLHSRPLERIQLLQVLSMHG
jgi:hypothetical protein